MCKENVLYLLSLCFLVEAFKERGIISLIGGCQRFFKRICVRYINLTLSKLFFMLFLYSIFSAVDFMQTFNALILINKKFYTNEKLILT